MKTAFYKYQGTGNDFILLDDRDELFPSGNHHLIARLCHRRFGIGADGLMLLRNHKDFDFEMIYFNSDGNLSSMCGNGGRCIAQFAYDLGHVNNTMRFKAADGPHSAEVLDSEVVKLEMGDVDFVEENQNYFVLDTGSPHYVSFRDDIEAHDFETLAKEIRYSPQFEKQGINVNFAKSNEHMILARTYERGVEAETYSCGTGAVAVALCGALLGMKAPIEIGTKGGKLVVTYERKGDKQFTAISLYGSAVFVFKGELDLNKIQAALKKEGI